MTIVLNPIDLVPKHQVKKKGGGEVDMSCDFISGVKFNMFKPEVQQVIRLAKSAIFKSWSGLYQPIYPPE